MDEGVPASTVASSFIKFKFNYLKSIAGVLKIVEFFLLLLAWALCSSFKNGFAVRSTIFDYSAGAVGFFLFTTVTFWIFVIILFLFNILSLIDKLRVSQKLLILSIIHGFWSVLLLISSAIVAADAVSLSKSPSSSPGLYCKNIDKYVGFKTTCETYDAAVAFGFLSFLAIVVDAVVHFFNHRNQS